MLHDDEPQFQLPDPGFLVLLIAVLVQRAGGSATITKDELYEISCGVLTEDARNNDTIQLTFHNRTLN